jgi:4-hydroxybenzoyl-CoA reductase subunit beta
VPVALPEFQLLRPRTLGEAVEMLARSGGSAGDGVKIIAGGTDLLPSLKQWLFTPRYLLDIQRVAGLTEFRWQPGEGLWLGAMTRVQRIATDDLIGREFAVLAEAAATIASPVLRNMGTLGGNLCLDTRCVWYNQSYLWRQSCGFCIKKDGSVCHVAPSGRRCWAAFSADMPPALLALEAEIEIASAGGLRRMRLAEFYTGKGEARIRLAADELVTRVLIPARSAGMRGRYRKLRVRGSIDYPLAGVAVVLRRENGHFAEGRVALTAVNPAPVLVSGIDDLLARAEPDKTEWVEEVVRRSNATAKPLTTSALTPDYRREIVKIYVRRALNECCGADHKEPA